MRDSELKIEIKLLKELLSKSGAISRRKVENWIRKRVDELISIDDIKIDVMKEKSLYDFNISVRALNCLKANDIDTVSDLVNNWPIELKQSRNFGKKTEQELELFLLQNKLI